MEEIKKYVPKSVLEMSDDEIRKIFGDKAGMYYGTNSNENSLGLANKIYATIKSEYPDITENKVKIYHRSEFVCPRDSFVMLFVMIPIDDFIKLRNENKLNSLNTRRIRK